MKKLLLLLLSVVVFSACTGVKEEVVDVENGASYVREVTGVDMEAEAEEEQDVPVVSAYEVKDYLFTASSTLVDDTNIGFNYEPAMVADMDFSTAWCRAAGDAEPSIVFDFSRPVKAENFGIVPGFARDEKIYFQNNRVKKATLLFDDKDPMEIELKDDYGMQFVELGGKEFSKIKLVIKDVYKGSKYDDACISEWDFVSEYVQKGDGVAAMDYYVKEKKADALRPYDIVAKVEPLMSAPDSCKNPELTGFIVGEPGDVGLYEDGSYYLWSAPKYVVAIINQFGAEGDELEFKWYEDQIRWGEEASDESVHLGWKFLGEDKDVPVVKSCDGKLFAYAQVVHGVDSFMFDYRVDVFNMDKLVGQLRFNFGQ